MLQTEDELDQEMCSKYGSSCIRDGITNIEKFYKEKYQILWILKEANAPDGNAWDMRHFHQDVRSYNRWRQTYQKIVQTSHGILNAIHDYNKIPESDDIVVDAMNSIAFINVKKVGGGASSKWKVINQHYADHKEFLHDQIEKISPNIIINCSGVWQLFENLSVSPIKASAPFHYSFDDNRLVINAYHPGERRLGNVKYFDVIAKIRESSGW